MNRFLHAIFCDDVREEKGNKLSLIGIYGADLFVSEFPAVLAKLAIFVTLVTPAEQPLGRLILRVKKDEEILAEATLSEADIVKHTDLVRDALSKIPQPSEGSMSLTTFRTVIVVSPFVVIGPCILRVIATTEGDDLRCPALRISLAPSAIEATSVVTDARLETDVQEPKDHLPNSQPH